MKKINLLYIQIVLVISALVFVSCSQDEGIGGNSHIKGRLMVNYYNDDFSVCLSGQPVPACDEDVFLLFGEDAVVGEDVTTSNTGNYEFEYLWPGKYTLYYYSDDTTGLTDEKVPVIKEITLKKNETLILDDLIINRKLKFDEGSCDVKGRIMVNYYNDDFSLLLREEPARDEDVFIQFGSHNTVTDDTKTSFDGYFSFNNIWPGDYTLYYYSADTTKISREDVPVVNQFSLAENQELQMNTLIMKRVLEWDEGSSTIQGTVFEVNYKNSSSYPNLEINYIVPSKEQEIYITYGNHTFYDERIRTASDGTFEFKNLIKGRYKIFLYSEDVTGKTDKVVIEREINISNDNEVYVIEDPIYVENL